MIHQAPDPFATYASKSHRAGCCSVSFPATDTFALARAAELGGTIATIHNGWRHVVGHTAYFTSLRTARTFKAEVTA